MTRDIVIEEFTSPIDKDKGHEVKDGMDIALCKLNGFELEYAGAHNPLWIIRNGGATVEEIKANKEPIGKFDNMTDYTNDKVILNPCDTFYIFSDGFSDQFGGDKNKKFKTANFKKTLLSIQNKSMDNQKALINQAFEDWKGDVEQLDDVCIIGVRV